MSYPMFKNSARYRLPEAVRSSSLEPTSPEKTRSGQARAKIGPGRKLSAQVSHPFMCFRIVSAFRPAPMASFATCRAYHVSDMLGRCRFRSR